MAVWLEYIPALVAVLPGVAVRLARVPRGRGRLRIDELRLQWPWWRRP